MATRSLNQVELIGNLTRDPELRYTSNGTAIATFTVATNRNYTDSSGNNVETAEFTNVVSWAKLAEICGQLLNKGTKVYIQGRLQTQRWEDKETGKDMRRTEVVATDMIVLSSGGNRSDDGGNYNDNSGGNNNSGSNNSDDMGENVDFSSFGEEVSDNSDGSAQNEGGQSESEDEDTSNATPF